MFLVGTSYIFIQCMSTNIDLVIYQVLVHLTFKTIQGKVIMLAFMFTYMLSFTDVLYFSYGVDLMSGISLSAFPLVTNASPFISLGKF
jgi:hypothetical protein